MGSNGYKPERRSASRHRVRLLVKTDRGEAETRDFSLSGLYLVTDASLSQGEDLWLQVAVPGPERSQPVWLSCRGSVVRVDEVEGCVGAAIAITEDSLRPLGAVG